MATVVFDFDSTLIPVESLEEVLAAVVSDPDVLERIAEITRRGMEGEIDFRTSLTSRLRLAAPSRDAVLSVGTTLAGRISPEARACVTWLSDSGHTVRIVSGGFRDVILPSARSLGLDDSRVHAVSAYWTDTGVFNGLIEDGFVDSKAEGIRRLDARWPRPVVGVGDGATDLALATSGFADAFIAFTEHVRRDFLDEADVPEAGNMAEVRRMLSDLI